MKKYEIVKKNLLKLIDYKEIQKIKKTKKNIFDVDNRECIGHKSATLSVEKNKAKNSVKKKRDFYL